MPRNLDEILSNIEKRINAIENRLKRIEEFLEATRETPARSWEFPEVFRTHGPRVPRILPSLPIVSELTPTEREVLKIIEEKREITASELAKLLNISPSSATRYLRGLYRLGLIRRKEKRSKGGKEIAYYR